MNSATNTQENSAGERFFLIDGTVDKYRWIGRRTEADGGVLARVRYAPVLDGWRPIGIVWVPETMGRSVCDFPIFYSIVRCFSHRAIEALLPYIKGALEVLPLDGLDDAYAGVHCIRWVEGAADLEGVDQSRISIHSSAFVPKLHAQSVAGLDVFGVPEMITKLFVSERFKNAVESAKLAGLEFREVALS